MSRKMENAKEGGLRRTIRQVFPSSYLRSLILHLSFSLLSSCSSALVYIQVFLSLVVCVASQRKLDITIQSTCFTFKSSCRVVISNRARGTPYVYVTTQDLQLFKNRAIPASAPSGGIRSVRFKVKGVRSDSEI